MRLSYFIPSTSGFGLFLVVFLLLLLLPFSFAFGQIELSGSLAGTLPAATYHVIDNITVPSSQILSIEAGAELLFFPNTELIVDGTLYAEGSIHDSVRFQRFQQNLGWYGIDVRANGFARFNYSVITGSSDVGLEIQLWGRHYTANSRISDNSDNDGDGGGIWSQGASLDTLITSVINNNDGQGYYADNSPIAIYDSYITANEGTGVSISQALIDIKNSTVSYNMMSGIRLIQAIAYIDSSRFTGNSGVYGGAIEVIGDHLDVKRTTFDHNSATLRGGAIGTPSNDYTPGIFLKHCNFISNICDGNGSVLYSGGINMKSCILTDNIGDATLYSFDNNLRPRYSLFHNNMGDNLIVEDGISPDNGFEIISQTNVNGDSCDAYFNLFLPVEYESTDNYYLSQNSPAIDAGDPELPLDPDESLPDMGVHYYSYTSVEPSPSDSNTLVEYKTKQLLTYPNPFNSTVTILYSSNIGTPATIVIVSLEGRTVYRDQIMIHPGDNVITWRARKSVSTGVYLVRVDVDGAIYTSKVTLIK